MRAAHCPAFFTWYNTIHRHSGIAYMTPHSVHYGRAVAMLAIRQAALDAAFRSNPNRFKAKTRGPLPCLKPSGSIRRRTTKPRRNNRSITH
jgi:hypothetical protein